MPEPARPPDDATIDAWLAGNLSHEESEGLEKYFAENPPPEEKVPAALSGIAATTTPPEEVSQLMKLLRTVGPSPLPPVRPGIWKEILTPSEAEGVLGTLGPYEVTDVIATGGMGIVFRARDPVLKRIAALKALSPDLAGNATARERFLREARAAAALEHDNILPLYSVHNDPSPWFAMRYVSGGNLQDALDRKEDFPLPRLKSIALQAASALAAAHQAGIVHRDIKPANIMLEENSERIWVCDFGIARSITDPSLTYQGSVAGTPLYMSPEQAVGELLDGRSDLFSLGSVLYHCATGRFPFAGETSAAVLKNVAKSEPPHPRKLNSKLPSWFARLLEKLLEKDPAERFPDADALIASLESERAPIGKKKARRRRILLSLATISLVAFGLLQLPQVRDQTNRVLVNLSGESFTIRGQLGTHETLSGAIQAAAPNATVELHRSEVIPVNIITIPAGKPLAIRAVHGARPVLANTGPNAHLKSFSPLFLEGLTFQPKKMERTSPGCLSLVGERHLIRNCTFIASTGPMNVNSAARPAVIQSSNGSLVRVKDCRFQLSEASVASVWDRRPQDTNPEPSRILFTDSLLTGSRALTIIRVDSNCGIDVGFERCLVSTDAVIMDHWNAPLKRVRIRSKATTFAPQHAFIWAARESPNAAAELIQWNSENDIFRLGAAFYSKAIVLPKPTKGTLVTLRSMWTRKAKGSFRKSRDLEFAFPGNEPDFAALTTALEEDAPAAALKTIGDLAP
ncbi:serine/threonine-protein kinase [Roseibacillus persicicus]|uniref:serine/threonine-protein kinase n=1 Tax=Roseibacillus persicicus TaxID=454148 RepID=UPI0028107135|nr:serine/threonine-protein kinase [Roseibacillus persicicus]MDQ8190151.1 serine/threonine-protein kinase [Roseibacillus persicicus]